MMAMPMAASGAVAAGFDDPVLDAQHLFRAVLKAMAEPGTLVVAPNQPGAPAPLYSTTAAVCLALADLDTPLWLDPALTTPAVRDYLRFHCGVPLVDSHRDAVFAVAGDPASLPGLATFAQGDAEYPERSATLVLQVETMSNDAGVTLSGPGIETSRGFAASPLPDGFWDQMRTNGGRFPCGVDVIFATPTHFAAIPRTTKVEG
jgi:alpha-D-ribose 1-methylphosphonate 5-triphosphate synthase subunit PhnH